MFLIPEITSEANSNSVINVSSIALTSGHLDTINASFGVLSEIYCQISSDKNGINGCKILRLFSKASITALYVFTSIGF